MVTEKIKAAAKQAASALSGKAGILNTLEGEHAEVLALMKKILTASSPAKAAENHYSTLRRKLLVHTRAEQEVLYAACEGRPATASALGDSRSQHRLVEQTVQELDRTPVDSPRWQDQLRRLHQLVKDHVEEEENVLFAQCEDSFENRELREFDRRYKDTRAAHDKAIVDVTLQRATATHAPPPGL